MKEEKNYDDFPLISKIPFKVIRPDGVPELNEEELNDARYWINYANAQKNASRNLTPYRGRHRENTTHPLLLLSSATKMVNTNKMQEIPDRLIS